MVLGIIWLISTPYSWSEPEAWPKSSFIARLKMGRASLPLALCVCEIVFASSYTFNCC